MSAGPFGCVQALGRHKQLWPISKSGFDSPIIDVSIPDSVITSVVEYSATLVYVSTDKGQIFEVNVKTQQVSPIIHIANEVTPLVFSPVVDPKHGPVLQQPLLLHRLRPGLPSDAAHQARKFPRFLAPRRPPSSRCRSRSRYVFPRVPRRCCRACSVSRGIACCC